MPWNEPGNDNQDPWSGKKRPTSGNGFKNPEELLAALNKKISDLFSKKGNGGGGGFNNFSSNNMAGIITLLVVLFIIWLFSGWYTVDARQQALVLRFGAYVETTGPGLHWHLPAPIEAIEIVDVGQNRSVEDRSTMLTKDENIIDIAVTVQYQINDPTFYEFNVEDIDGSLGQARGTLYDVMRSSVREIVGRNDMDFILKDGREQIAIETQKIMQHILDGYKAGVRLIKVNLTYAEAPQEVKDAFDEANKAREDANRFQNEADTYAKKILPAARGDAAHLTEDAKAYRETKLTRAEGDVARFSQLLTEYQKAPDVTRERLYLETMENVFSNARKAVIDTKNNNMLYLPLDGLSAAPVPPPPPTSRFVSSDGTTQDGTNSTGTNATGTNPSGADTRQERSLNPNTPRQER